MKSLQPYEVDRGKKNQRDACLEITFTVILKKKRGIRNLFGGNQRSEWSFELRLVCVEGGACSFILNTFLLSVSAFLSDPHH